MGQAIAFSVMSGSASGLTVLTVSRGLPAALNLFRQRRRS